MLGKKEIEYASKLARIKLTSQEKERLQKDLSNVLNYVEKLQSLETGNIESISRLTNLRNVTRKDEIKDFPEKELIKNLFPGKNKNFLEVKPIF